MTYLECLDHCAATPALVREFDRLAGQPVKLATVAQRSGITRAIDEASGAERDAAMAFAAFVYEYIWYPLAYKAMSNA